MPATLPDCRKSVRCAGWEVCGESFLSCTASVFSYLAGSGATDLQNSRDPKFEQAASCILSAFESAAKGGWGGESVYVPVGAPEKSRLKLRCRLEIFDSWQCRRCWLHFDRCFRRRTVSQSSHETHVTSLQANEALDRPGIPTTRQCGTGSGRVPAFPDVSSSVNARSLGSTKRQQG